MLRLSHLFVTPLLAAIIERSSRGADAVDVVTADRSSCSSSLVDEACISASDTSISATAAAAAAADDDNDDDTFPLPKNASITDFLDPDLLDPEILADIQSNLLAGNLVVIRDAFKVEFAEFVWEQLSREDVEWQHGQYFHPEGREEYVSLDNSDVDSEDKDNSNLEKLRQQVKLITKQYRSNNNTTINNHNDVFTPEHAGHNTRKKEVLHLPKQLQRIQTIFNSTSTKQFMSSLSGRSCSGTTTFIPTQYSFGDYSSPHTDFKKLQSVDYEWTLTKHWHQKYGGAFYWGNGLAHDEKVFLPTFNTLMLFLPSMKSTHYVFPVEKKKMGGRGRLSIKGRFHSNLDEIDSYLDERVKDGKGENQDNNHMRLNYDEAVSIAHDLNPEEYTDNPQRQQSLRELQQSINNTYLYADYEAKFVVSWENESDQVDVPVEDIRITKDSSILDFLNPKILQDPELLSEIGSNLRQGKMIILRQAFKPEFAEYAWRQMNRDDVQWHGKKATYNNVPLDAKKSTMSPELRRVLNVFKHTKSIEFIESISGRNCGGKGSTRGATWYKPGAYAPPHTDFGGDGSVTLNWDLTKDWDATYGGSFYWFPSKTMDGGYNTRSFNTLMWFLPTPSSTHAIIPVSWWAESRLFYIAAIYESDNEDFESSIANNRLEEDYANEEDYIKLNGQQASWIVHKMNPREMTEDPIKRKKLFALREGVATKYLYVSGNTFILDSEEEDEA